MKNSLLFLALYLLFIPFFNLTASEQPQCQLLELPQEITQHNISRHLKVADISALKQTCKQQANKSFDYYMLHPEAIEQIDELHCTKMISYLARTQQEQNFSHFFTHNNAEKRKEALQLLSWPSNGNSDIQQLMLAHCMGFNAQVDTCPDWEHLSKNQLVSAIVSLSDNPNIQDNARNTLLIWTSFYGYTKIVQLLLTHPNITINTQNTKHETALMWASRRGHIDVVKLLLALPHIDITIKDFAYKKTAFTWAYDNGHAEIAELLRSKLISSNTQ